MQRHGRADVQGRHAEVDDPEGLQDEAAAGQRSTPIRTARSPQRESGRQVGSGATSNVHRRSRLRARPRSSRIRVSSDAQTLDCLADRPATGSARGGSGRARRARSRPRPLRGSARTAPGRPFAPPRAARPDGPSRAWLRRSARPLSASVRRSRAPDSVSRSRSSWARCELALSRPPRTAEATVALRDLEPARVLVALRRQLVKIARSSFFLARPGTAIRAADAGLEPVAQRRLVAGEIAQLVMADGRGRAEERLGRDARELGEDLVGERRVGDAADRRTRDRRCPSGPRTHFSRVPVAVRPSSSSCSNSIATHGRASAAASHGRSDLEVAGVARHPASEGELDGSLDGRLAGLVRAADDGDARGQVDVELAVAAQVADLQPADPHSDTSWPASSSRPSRSASRSSAASAVGVDAGVGRGCRLELGDARLEIADEGAGDGVGRRKGALGQGRRAHVADAHLQERRQRARPRSRRGGGRARPGGRRRSGRRGRGPDRPCA